MSLRLPTMAGSLVLGAAAIALASPALAVCDAYSGTCTEPTEVLNETLTTPSDVGAAVAGEGAGAGGLGRTQVTTPAAVTPATLPFTGGELVLVSTLGLAAVAGGVGLVVAGRRRAADSA